MKNHLLRYVN
jgi:hypothetical protein